MKKRKFDWWKQILSGICVWTIISWKGKWVDLKYEMQSHAKDDFGRMANDPYYIFW